MELNITDKNVGIVFVAESEYVNHRANRTILILSIILFILLIWSCCFMYFIKNESLSSVLFSNISAAIVFIILIYYSKKLWKRWKVFINPNGVMHEHIFFNIVIAEPPKSGIPIIESDKNKWIIKDGKSGAKKIKLPKEAFPDLKEIVEEYINKVKCL